jgi:hypothetical protein
MQATAAPQTRMTSNPPKVWLCLHASPNAIVACTSSARLLPSLTFLSLLTLSVNPFRIGEPRSSDL